MAKRSPQIRLPPSITELLLCGGLKPKERDDPTQNPMFLKPHNHLSLPTLSSLNECQERDTRRTQTE